MANICRKWLRLRGLSPWERSLLVRALLWLPATALALKVLGFRRSLRVLLGDAVSGPRDEKDSAVAQRIAGWVAFAASRGWCRGNCLSRSITLCRLLRSEGFPATLRIGVRKHDENFEAHAWVEYCGTVINDGPEVGQRYMPLWGQTLG